MTQPENVLDHSAPEDHTTSIDASVNGVRTTLAENTTVKQLLESHNPSHAPVAVAKNNEFVPRGQYETTVIKHGDALDIVSPVGGG